MTGSATMAEARTGAVLALLLGVAASPVAEAALQPHRAAYRLSLADAHQAGAVSAVQGGLAIEWEQVCDGWLSQQRLLFVVASEEGEGFGQDVRYSSWEASDGSRIRYTVRSFQGEALQEEFRGEARLDPGKGGAASFTTPTRRDVALPRGTIFPTDHLERVIEAAGSGVRDGVQVVSHQVFDGWGFDALTQITSVIGPPRMLDAATGDSGQPGGKGRAWPVSMAYYKIANRSDLPEFEATFLLTEDGVLRNLLLDYGDFKMEAALEKLELLSSPDC